MILISSIICLFMCLKVKTKKEKMIHEVLKLKEEHINLKTHVKNNIRIIKEINEINQISYSKEEMEQISKETKMLESEIISLSDEIKTILYNLKNNA